VVQEHLLGVEETLPLLDWMY